MAARLTLRVLTVLGAASILAGVSSPAAAQIPQRFENLQVLPKDIPRDTLTAIMRAFTGALGVRCTYCHIEREGGGGGGGGLNLNFASDSLANKRIARRMLVMADSINRHFLASIPERDQPPTNVNCMTCHRGLPKPMTIQSVLLTTTTRVGVDSAIARYRTLRENIAAGMYDFREAPVTEVAQRLSAQGRHEDAIKLLQMNQEFHPNSVGIDLQLADAYIAKGDRDAGIARLRAVLAKNPNDRRAQQRLQQLGVQP
ncbi:MAG TPA: c-type cytochrome [Gemmatimonadaceae bacterium]|nr:c-type cytochrome [Gemmatimonadaceae bacterium]